MALNDVLNADMATVGGWLKSAVAAWLEELAACLPARWRDRGVGDTRLVARWTGDPAVPFFFLRRGLAVSPPRPGRRRTGVILVLPAAQVLVRETVVPMLSSADLDRLLAFEVDRLTPFPADQVFAASRVVARDRETGRATAELAVVRRETARTALADAELAGLLPSRLSLLDEEVPRFDFLPAMRVAGEQDLPRSDAPRCWIAIVILLALNLVTVIGRDVASVSRMQEAVDAETPTATTATTFRSRVQREQQRRVQLARLRAGHEPLAAMAAATVAVPGDAWVQRYAWTGGSLRLTGYKKGSVDLIAALRHSPAFANVRAASSDVPAQVATGQPFDIVADMRPVLRQ